MRDIKFANEVILAARNHMNAINKVLIPSRFQEKSERTEQREKKRISTFKISKNYSEHAKKVQLGWD